MAKSVTDETLVEQAQNGNSEATMALLVRYQDYINTYYRLLQYGRVDLKNKDQRRFLQLYMKDKDIRNGMVNRNQPSKSRHQAYKTASYLQYKCENIPKEDMKQDLTLLFIDAVMRYEQRNRLFVSYIKNYYRYRVEWYLRRVFKYDWFNHPYLSTLGYESSDIPGDGPIEVDEAWFDRFLANALRKDFLDLFWVNGRCSSFFKDLTVFERTILRDRYHLELTDGEIANRYGYHINSIWLKRQKIIKQLKEKKEREGI